ncbi:hypothetical protein Rhow_000749 [Rhodococcus wratislaviensis]|uniref:Glycosyl transferase family 51 domain-containing protein n=1 Tax=Rhodococcus wratislaviensis TaxID=44752 RepID=A0A402C2N8_RHOWR|nr:hypothetical protein Rhow_000749 [Rhodococcus wratislaviensis]
MQAYRAGEAETSFSTIPQQLAKNMFFTTEKSAARKALELVPAYLTSAVVPDRRIVEL